MTLATRARSPQPLSYPVRRHVEQSPQSLDKMDRCGESAAPSRIHNISTFNFRSSERRSWTSRKTTESHLAQGRPRGEPSKAFSGIRLADWPFRLRRYRRFPSRTNRSTSRRSPVERFHPSRIRRPGFGGIPPEIRPAGIRLKGGATSFRRYSAHAGVARTASRTAAACSAEIRLQSSEHSGTLCLRSRQGGIPPMRKRLRRNLGSRSRGAASAGFRTTANGRFRRSRVETAESRRRLGEAAGIVEPRGAFSAEFRPFGICRFRPQAVGGDRTD